MVSIENVVLDGIARNIIKEVNGNREQVFKVKLTISELSALEEVAFSVYNYLSEMEDRGFKFGKEMKRYMENLREGYEKLNNA